MSRFLCTIFVLAVCALSIEVEAQAVDKRLMRLFRPKVMKCAADLNLSADELKRIVANDLTDRAAEAECLSLCCFKAFYMFNADDTINVEITKAVLAIGAPDERVNEVVDRCKSETGTTSCETARLVYECMVTNGLIPTQQD